MRTRWLRLSKVLLAVGIVAIAVTVPIDAAQKGKPAPKPATVPLQVTFDGAPGECGIGNDWFTGEGAPVPYKNGFQKVSVWINDDDSQGMRFEAGPSSQESIRKVSLRFCGDVRDADGNIVSSPPLLGQELSVDAWAFLYSLHERFDSVPPLRRMKSGDTLQFFLYVQWPISSPQYRLWWGQNGGFDVTCTAGDTLSDGTLGCQEWKAVRSSTGEAITGRAELYTFTGGKKSNFMERPGLYYDMPFEMTITKCQTADCQ